MIYCQGEEIQSWHGEENVAGHTFRFSTTRANFLAISQPLLQSAPLRWRFFEKDLACWCRQFCVDRFLQDLTQVATTGSLTLNTSQVLTPVCVSGIHQLSFPPFLLFFVVAWLGHSISIFRRDGYKVALCDSSARGGALVFVLQNIAHPCIPDGASWESGCDNPICVTSRGALYGGFTLSCVQHDVRKIQLLYGIPSRHHACGRMRCFVHVSIDSILMM